MVLFSGLSCLMSCYFIKVGPVLGPVRHYDQLVPEMGAGCFPLLCYVSARRYSYSLVSILYKSIASRYRPVRLADGPITARCRFM